MSKKSAIEFLRPSVLKIVVFVFFVGLFSLISKHILTRISIIPCRIVRHNIAISGFCPVNPLTSSTIYLYYPAIESAYIVFYLLAVFIVLPYLASCLMFYIYSKVVG